MLIANGPPLAISCKANEYKAAHNIQYSVWNYLFCVLFPLFSHPTKATVCPACTVKVTSRRTSALHRNTHKHTKPKHILQISLAIAQILTHNT